MTLKISNTVTIPETEIQLIPIRAQGAGGQNVNKVASAIHLRFNILQSSLPDLYKQRLLGCNDSRITDQGVIVIKAQQFRTREKNKVDALERLRLLIKKTIHTPKKRKPTKISKAAKKKRADFKTRRGALKKTRRKVSDD